MLSAPTGIERTGPAIRAVLAQHAPEQLADFAAQFRIALATADDNFDLRPAQAVIDKWWPIAYLRLHPLTEEERETVTRVRAGDYTGLWSKDDDGNWVKL
ncbi:hypothetical protein A5658_05015 [Mycobacterium sp. 1245111.1]|uniref:DUF6247 family protein n=1 Tax=Mycobacterium sp. 1245111.1 TaxID=1834073 RepID=UPI0007FC818B|nr:DUF6247 family protein [Mycobacterium sp. 1245111.1]OBK37021.1 hypothetical protein A5658_05015 [Mycobacterium sp. 1245111.1]